VLFRSERKAPDTDVMDGILWLTPQQAAEVWQTLRDFISSHATRRPGTQAYNFVVFGGPDTEDGNT